MFVKKLDRYLSNPDWLFCLFLMFLLRCYLTHNSGHIRKKIEDFTLRQLGFLMQIIVIFADDCFLFIKATTSHVRLIKQVLDSFSLEEGFKINTYKSRFLAPRNCAYVEGLI